MRTRLVKPGFFKDADLAQCQPLARILFLGLACLADREGRLRDKPLEIKVEILPHDTVDMEAMLNELHGARLITRYAVGSLRLIQVSKDSQTFQKHARPHKDESCEGFPPPSETETGNAGKFPGELSSSSASSSASSTDLRSGVCSERSRAIASEPPESPAVDLGFARKSANKRPLDDAASKFVLVFPCCGPGSTYEQPLDWGLTAGKLEEYKASFPGVDVLAESRKAQQWCRDNPAKRKTPRGMPAFMTRWLTRAQDRGGLPGKGPPPKPPESEQQRKDRLRREREERDRSMPSQAETEAARRLLLQGIGRKVEEPK